MYLTDDQLAKLLLEFLRTRAAMGLVRYFGLKSAHPSDFAGEIYQALRRQRPSDVRVPEVWIRVNARWHLRNAVRREKSMLLNQSVADDLIFTQTYGKGSTWR